MSGRYEQDEALRAKALAACEGYPSILRRYVTMAGGYGYKAKKSKAYVVYMNGTVAKAKGGSRKVIEPGCEIIVPTKIQDPTVLPTIMSIVSATSSTASMLSTIYALINSATK